MNEQTNFFFRFNLLCKIPTSPTNSCTCMSQIIKIIIYSTLFEIITQVQAYKNVCACRAVKALIKNFISTLPSLHVPVLVLLGGSSWLHYIFQHSSNTLEETHHSIGHVWKSNILLPHSSQRSLWSKQSYKKFHSLIYKTAKIKICWLMPDKLWCM